LTNKISGREGQISKTFSDAPVTPAVRGFYNTDLGFLTYNRSDFAKARDKAWDKDENDEKKHNQMPKHKNVIKNYVNFELFHKKDVDKEDCLGWVTVMEKANGTLKTILKQETDIDDRIDMAEVIWSGFSYLEKIGIEHFDFKIDNVLLLNGVPKIIDFGLICETTGRTGYRKMGYSRRGSKFRHSLALGNFFLS
jgi:serine/threonine protein kinase